MSDITSEQWAEYQRSMDKSVGLLGQIAKQLGADHKTGNSRPANRSNNQHSGFHNQMTQSAAQRRIASELQRGQEKTGKITERMGASIERASSGLKLLDADSRSLSYSFGKLVKTFAGGAVIGAVLDQMIDLGTHWVKAYRDMAEHGQTFSGSVVDMARQAAAAGLPLEQFASYVTKNAKIMSHFGSRDVTKLAKEVREATHHVGMYGYSVEGMNEVTATWLDMQRAQGNRWAAVNSTSSSSIQNFAKEITELSAATGKSREDILKGTADFSKSADMTAAMMADPALKGNEALQNTIARIQSSGDAAADLLGNGLASAMMAPTRMFESGTVELMNRVGLGGPMYKALREFETGLRNGSKTADDWGAVEQTMVGLVQGNIDQIIQMGKTDPEILKLTQAVIDIQSRNVDAGKKAVTGFSAITAFLTTIADKLNNVKGAFLDGILAGLQTFDNVLTGMVADGSMEKFAEMAKKVGYQLGIVLGDMLKFMTTKGFQDAIIMTTKALVGLGQLFMMLAGWAVKVTAGFQRIATALVGEGAGGLLGALAALTTFLVGKSLFKSLFSGMSRMNVTAGMVYVNGAPAGGGFGGGFGGGEGGKPGGKGRLRMPKGRAGQIGLILGLAGLAYGAYSMAGSPSDDIAASDKTPMLDPNDPTQQIADNTAAIAATNQQMAEQGNAEFGPTAYQGLNNVKDSDGSLTQIDSTGAYIVDANTVANPATNVGPPQEPEVSPGVANTFMGYALAALGLGTGTGLMIKNVMKDIGTKNPSARLFGARGMFGKTAGAIGGRMLGTPLMVGMEAAGYIPALGGDKAVTGGNVMRSGGRLGATMAGAAAGGWLGAKAGGMLGALVGPEGIPIGAAIGGFGGSLYGGYKAWSVADSLMGEDDKRAQPGSAAKPKTMADYYAMPMASLEKLAKTDRMAAEALRYRKQGVKLKGATPSAPTAGTADPSMVSTPGAPPTLTQPSSYQLSEMRRKQSGMEGSLQQTPLDEARAHVEASTLRILGQMREMNEAMVDKLERNLRNQVVMVNVMKGIRDGKPAK